MTSSASSASSKHNAELQADHPCKCDMSSCVKISRTPENPGKKFRVCQNSLSARTPKCNFWEWLEEDEYEVEKNCDLGQIYNLTLKLGNLENKISICRKKLEEEKNYDLVFRQELDKVKWEFFTHKVALFMLFFLYVKDVVFKV
ncbi:unnamed protein product [Lactuca saligna]|uniref:GRF-type domain-containing protein n=1 Tax=Lactuca saligna TaxID=75948 RepID=A0AA36E7Y9_LACSI|nr:unnamed protein product [Lactuca saligna]